MTVPSRELWLTPSKTLATHSKFYPAKITVSHHQLRHFISSSEKDLVYYVSCKDVFVLDLATQQNSLIATIPFESRCLAADLGWVCVGGEQNGDCAFIKIEKDEHDRPTCFGHDMNIDMLGGEIVNAMSIHSFLNHGKTPDEPVVLISNNDKTVKVYSLAQRKVLTTLVHPVPMNFSALSPDSTILAAVGDSDRVYFYRRHLEKAPATGDSSSRYAQYLWRMFANPTVPTGDPVYDDHSFAVTFSPSGYLCAASSQGGSISVFDMQHLLSSNEPGESSIICTFRSSRQALFGCVRSMTFSPAPWDLLVWAEDHGRIGIADVRQSCVRRQILDLDRQKTEEVKLEDGTPVAFRNIGHKERLTQQRLARLRAMRNLSSRGLDNELGADDLLNESVQRHRRRDLVNYEGLDLDARERSVVEALDRLMDNMDTPPPSHPTTNSSTASPAWIAGRLTNDGSSRSVGPRHHEPRRRSSVILSEPNGSRYLDLNPSHRLRLSASPARIGDDEDPAATSTNTSIPAPGSESQPGPSTILPNARSAIPTAPGSDSSHPSQTLLTRVEAALDAERQLGNQLERQLADERQLSLLLRRQLDTQQRLLSENSYQLERLRAVARESHGQIAASLERIVQRQLTYEQEYLQQRSRELQSQLRVGTEYFRRLETERDRLLGGVSGGSDVNTVHASDMSSARTTTLPTTNLSSSGQSDSVPSILAIHSESSRERLAHVENLERQVRRAESRVAQAVLDTQALENVILHNFDTEFAAMQRTLSAAEARLASIGSRLDADSNAHEAAAAAASNTAGTGSPPRERLLIVPPSAAITAALRRVSSGPPAQRAGAGSGNEAGRVDVTRSGAGRIDAETRVASIMFLSNLSGNRSLDANGNWMPVAAGSRLQRVMGPGGRSTVAAGVAGQVELGTTGIAFSPDGQFLYAGSEEGIFEFKVNLRDRMAFPSFEVR
ncbi:hypothetical protein AYL99_10488 [Fonsecaea erecta]|uniref:DUF2415 domain-containing protein n=1 Tax=Fonsecaea erecta TaxID=1367422 RepID=A0A178Z914_9EURO|nr:hypothetical protein AYL99_10488 [Fonsecaea erecta]OAP55515.1 hypothetical protein AYL99_10488 [Fonsecaea erecta]